MTKRRYERHIERNEILTKHYDFTMLEDEKVIITDNINSIIRRTKAKNTKAKIGKVSALEILYELGRFLNRVAD